MRNVFKVKENTWIKLISEGILEDQTRILSEVACASPIPIFCSWLAALRVVHITERASSRIHCKAWITAITEWALLILYFDDFDAISSQHDKFGGEPVTWNKIVSFNNFLNTSCLFDLSFHDAVYTWSNKQSSSSHIRERLDKAYDTPEWVSSFREAIVHHLPVDGKRSLPYLCEATTTQRRGAENSDLKPCRWGIRSTKIFLWKCAPNVLDRDSQIRWQGSVATNWYALIPIVEIVTAEKEKSWIIVYVKKRRRDKIPSRESRHII